MNVGKGRPATPGADWNVDIEAAAEKAGVRFTVEMPDAIMELAMMTATSVAALGPAMAAFKGTTTPQLARAVQATENVWKAIEAEFGLLTSHEVAKLIGTGKSGRSLASDQRAAGKLIGAKRGNKVLYPGFQFDVGAGKVRPATAPLIATAKEVGWDEEDLVLWLMAPSGYFDGDRPVDHLDDPNLAEKARRKATVEW